MDQKSIKVLIARKPKKLKYRKLYSISQNIIFKFIQLKIKLNGEIIFRIKLNKETNIGEKLKKKWRVF